MRVCLCVRARALKEDVGDKHRGRGHEYFINAQSSAEQSAGVLAREITR